MCFTVDGGRSLLIRPNSPVGVEINQQPIPFVAQHTTNTYHTKPHYPTFCFNYYFID